MSSSGQAWAPTAVDGETTAPGKKAPPVEVPSRVGEILDRYALLEEVGKGGMGVVYRAYDPKLQREVALKLVTRQDPGARLRIVREARAMAQLRHENVVSVYDVVETDAGPVLVMPLLQGGNLREELARATPWRRILELFVRAGRGLEAAHASGLIHRDFKPDNVLLSVRGEVLVTDFGLAQSSGRAERGRASNTKTSGPGVTQAGAVMGTNYYMAPEQHMGKTVGPATDQFAFCASLWEALNGDPPFVADSARGYYDAKQAGPPTWTATDVPRRIARAVERGLAFEPDKRWPNMGALLGELDRNPATKAWMLGGGAATLGLIAALVATSPDETSGPTCPDPQKTLEETWSPEVEEGLRAAILDTGLPYAENAAAGGIRRLNAYADEWRVAFTKSCHATRVEGTQSDELLDRSMACLEQARTSLGYVVAELSLGESKTLLRQDRVIETLPDPAACNDKVRLMADQLYAAEASEGYGPVIERQAAIRAKQGAGQFKAADDAAAELIKLIDDDAEPDVRWAVLRLRGTTLTDVRKFDAAEELLREALTIAQGLDDDRKVLDSLVSLAWLSIRSQPGDEDVLTLLASAQGVAQRIGEPDAWEDYAHPAIRAHDELGNYDEARELSEEFLRRVETRDARDELSIAKAQYRVAANIRDPSRALALLENVEKVYVDHYGPKHPSVGWVQNDQATNYGWLGDEHRLIERQKQALETWREAYPEGHYTVGAALNNMSGSYGALGDLESAVGVSSQALEIYDELDLEDSRYAAMAYNNRANAYRSMGKDEAARGDLERALEIRTALYPEGHPAPAKAKLRLGGLLVELDDPEDKARGLELVQEGWATIDSIDADLGLRHEATLELAKALWAAQPHDDVRARVSGLCRTALEISSALGDPDREARTIQFYVAEVED